MTLNIVRINTGRSKKIEGILLANNLVLANISGVEICFCVKTGIQVTGDRVKYRIQKSENVKI